MGIPMMLVLSLACTLAAHGYHTSPPVDQCPIHAPSTCTMGLDMWVCNTLFWRMDSYCTVFYSYCGLNGIR